MSWVITPYLPDLEKINGRRFVGNALEGSPRGRSFIHHPCFAVRLGGVSDGNYTQGWRDSSQTAMPGGGKVGSAKLPMATMTVPGKPSFSQ